MAALPLSPIRNSEIQRRFDCRNAEEVLLLHDDMQFLCGQFQGLLQGIWTAIHGTAGEKCPNATLLIKLHSRERLSRLVSDIIQQVKAKEPTLHATMSRKGRLHPSVIGVIEDLKREVRHCSDCIAKDKECVLRNADAQ
jgi:hypothetical protein